MQKKAFYNTKLGVLEIHCTEKYITYIKFTSDTEAQTSAMGNTRTSSESNADILKLSESNKLSDRAMLQINEYLDNKRTQFDLPLFLEGTDFQKKVWQSLCKIPYGQTMSYKAIATAIGNPKAARAVGMANNKNPIQIVVPCHRVIGSDGSLVGYAGGLTIKQQLLYIEQSKLSYSTNLLP